jgi:hypothetical protein
MTDEEEAKLDQARLEERARFSDLLIKAGHEKRELRLIAWLAGGAGLGLGVLLGRWTKRDQRR